MKELRPSEVVYIDYKPKTTNKPGYKKAKAFHSSNVNK